jgi:hypothetical protein
MFSKQAKYLVLLIAVLMAILLFAFGIDTFLEIKWPGASSASSDSPGAYLAIFILGIIFLPGALRRYHEKQREERSAAWYQHLDLVLCFYGLLCGLFFLLSLWIRWVSFMRATSTVLSNPLVFGGATWLVELILHLVMVLTWISLIFLFYLQWMRQKSK